MRVPLSWLRDFAPLDHPVEVLVAALDDLGLAVEAVERIGEGLEGVVVAEVVQIDAIPEADRIRRVLVDAGGPEHVQVVCGAWNFGVGDLVPLATVGSVLPGDFAIGARRMKGVASHGMLCAPDELGLPGSHDGILLLPAGLRPGTPFAEAMGITADVVVDLEVNPNRPDAMSIAGVARDLAARLGVPFAIPEPEVTGPTSESGVPASVVLDAPDLCGRFVAAVIGGISVGPSPAWIANRLTLAGMRPINNVVDASNYVMIELGTPNHAYDLARLRGRGLVVRRAEEGEVLVTLDDVERHLGADDLLICDAERAPVGIAGIMGGASSEIGPDTSEVLLEAAWFLPIAVARSSRRLKLRTEASARFEKGVDWAILDTAVARFCQLLGVATSGLPIDERGQLPSTEAVSLRVARVNALLGTDLPEAEIRRHLDAIGFATAPAGDGVVEVLIPSWRPDSATEIDVVEEVARLHGYSAITRTVPSSSLTGGLSPYQRDRRLVRQLLAGLGASEAWSTTFLSVAAIARCGLDAGAAVVVTNPLVADESRLRPSLLPGLLAAVAYNADRRQRGVELFEVGKVFASPEPGAPLPVEREVAALALAGSDATEAVGAWQVLVEGLLLEDTGLEACEVPGLHPTRTAWITVAGQPVGVLGEVDPDVRSAHGIDEPVAWLEVDLEVLLAIAHGPQPYRPVSRFPSSDLDLAFEVPEATPAGSVARVLRQADELVVDVRLFDVYRGEQVSDASRSLALTVRLQAPDRTLTDEAAAEVRHRLVAAVEGAGLGRLRG